MRSHTALLVFPRLVLSVREPADAGEAVHEYRVLLAGNEAGEQIVAIDDAGRLEITYRFNDRGRGPDTVSTYVLDGTGIPRTVSIAGEDYMKSRVTESFARGSPRRPPHRDAARSRCSATARRDAHRCARAHADARPLGHARPSRSAAWSPQHRCGRDDREGLANDHDQLLQIVELFDAGTAVGPWVLRAGFIDGPGPFAGPLKALVATEAEAARWVDFYASHGYQQIKVYSSLDTALVAFIARRTHERGMRLSGHVPAGMWAEDAVRAGFEETQTGVRTSESRISGASTG